MPRGTITAELSRLELYRRLTRVTAEAFGSGSLQLGTTDFTPLNWLLRDEITGSHFRRQRRKVYGMYVRALELALTTVYRERMMAVGGPWDFEALTAKKGQADKAIRQLRWCSVLHFFRLPGRYIASERAYVAAMRCLQSVVSIADYRR